MEEDERASSEPTRHPPWAYRGHDVSRILALSDGIFAFAMTLLVLGLVLPAGTSGAALGTYLHSSSFLGTLFAYVLTFFIIGIWWRSHHGVFNYIEHYDGQLVRLNLVFLVFIAILPFAVEVLNASGSSPAGDIFFALSQIGAALVLGKLWAYASGEGHLTARIPEEWKDFLKTQYNSFALVFAISIPVAFVDTTLAQVIWMVMLFVGLVHRKPGRKGHVVKEPLPETANPEGPLPNDDES